MQLHVWFTGDVLCIVITYYSVLFHCRHLLLLPRPPYLYPPYIYIFLTPTPVS